MLSLKIDNQFIALPDSTEISIEASNPIFFDAGAKTYLFEIPVESLRYIIGNADGIYGESLYDVLEGKRAEMYIDGVQFFSGVVNLEDEISVEDGKIAVSIASGNLEFAQMIEGMNCRDVEQAEEVTVGYKYTQIDATWTRYGDVEVKKEDNVPSVIHKSYFLPDEFTVIRSSALRGDNVSEAYPNKKYCTIRAAYPTNKNLTVEYHKYINWGNYVGPKRFEDQISCYSGDIFILESARRNSGICFYVNYFLECLVKTLGIQQYNNRLTSIEDFNRLAFVNMRCKVSYKNDTVKAETLSEAMEEIGGINLFSSEIFSLSATAWKYKAIATSENFPNESVSEVINSISDAFCAKFLYDSDSNQMKVILMKDIMTDSEIKSIQCEITSTTKINSNKAKGFRLSYKSNKDDTSYNFSRFQSSVPVDSYGYVISLTNPFDNNTYIDARNGNAYVIKVDEEGDSTGDEKKLLPSLFEVGDFSSVEYGDCSNNEFVEDHSIGFKPIINIDSEAKNNIDKAKNGKEDSDLEITYALLIDEEIEHGIKSFFDTRTVTVKRDGKRQVVSIGSGFSYYDFLGSNGDVSSSSLWKPAQKETIVNSYDTGFMLGIMRGPGSDSKPDTYAQNFDGEGNYRVAFTAANYAFTSDSIDNCNRDFDYNGAAEGVGPDELNGRFSLKLRAGKYDKDGNPIKDADGNPIIIQDKARAERGLYDKFWKEYAYFTVNKKIIRLTCGMEIADIINLDWTKRYRIGEWTGFIAGYSFNVNKDGMSEVELELYYI